jgi:hypothetical protein
MGVEAVPPTEKPQLESQRIMSWRAQRRWRPISAPGGNPRRQTSRPRVALERQIPNLSKSLKHRKSGKAVISGGEDGSNVCGLLLSGGCTGVFIWASCFLRPHEVKQIRSKPDAKSYLRLLHWDLPARLPSDLATRRASLDFFRPP